MGDEGVEFVDPDQLLEEVEKVEALFVGHGREGVVRVLALEVGDEFCEVVAVAELGDRVAQRLPADDGAEVAPGVGAVDEGLDAALEVRGPAFVEPEVLPGAGGDEVAGPRVRELVGDDVDVLAVAGDDGRGCESVDWVLHAAVGEGCGEDEDVVLLPGVGVDEGFGGSEERLGRGGELPCAGLEGLRVRGDGAAGADGGGGDLAAGEGEEVARDRNGLVEFVEVESGGGGRGSSGRVGFVGEAAGDDGERGGDAEVKGGLYVGRVLAGEDGAGVDGLTLGEHVGVLLARGLGGREPLESGARLCGGDVDRDEHRLAVSDAAVELDLQGGAIWLETRQEVPCRGLAVDVDLGDVEVAGVEDDLGGLGMGDGL